MNHQENIMNVYHQAHPVEIGEGLKAYELYNQTLKEIAEKFALPESAVIGAFSALSPNSDYAGNLRSCYTVCKGYSEGRSETNCTVSTYNHNRAKAWRLLEGEHFYSVFKGLKVRNFFRNLSEPNHPEAVTIDGHMYNIYRNQVYTMSRSGITPKQYHRIATCMRKTADDIGILPSQLQAILWLVWKRLHNIKSDWNPFQEELFENENRCGIYVPVEVIQPYPIKE